MKLITEYTENDVEFITEAKEGGGKKHMIEGVFAQAESKNRNGRIYPQMVMEKAVGKYVAEQVSQKAQLLTWIKYLIGLPNSTLREEMLWVKHLS